MALEHRVQITPNTNHGAIVEHYFLEYNPNYYKRVKGTL